MLAPVEGCHASVGCVCNRHVAGRPGVSEIAVGNGPGALPRIRVVLWPPTGPIQRLEFFALELP